MAVLVAPPRYIPEDWRWFGLVLVVVLVVGFWLLHRRGGGDR